MEQVYKRESDDDDRSGEQRPKAPCHQKAYSETSKKNLFGKRGSRDREDNNQHDHTAVFERIVHTAHWHTDRIVDLGCDWKHDEDANKECCDR